MAPTGPTENFIKQAPVEMASMPRGFYKSLVLDVFDVLAAAAFSLTYYWYLTDQVRMLVPLIVLIIFSITSTLEVMLIKSIKRRTLIILLEVLALFSFFLNLPNGLLFAAFGLTLFFLVWGEINSRREISNSLEPSYFKTSRLKLTKLVSAITLMMIIIYFPKFSIREKFLSEASFQTFFASVSGYITRLYPEARLDGSVKDFADNLADFQIKRLPGFSDLSVPKQAEVKQAASTQILEKIKDSLKIEIDANETALNLSYNLISSNIERFKNEFSNQFRVAWTIILFLVVRSFGVVFMILAATLSVAITHLLLALSLIYVAGETRTKETLTF